MSPLQLLLLIGQKKWMQRTVDSQAITQTVFWQGGDPGGGVEVIGPGVEEAGIPGDLAIHPIGLQVCSLFVFECQKIEFLSFCCCIVEKLVKFVETL